MIEREISAEDIIAEASGMDADVRSEFVQRRCGNNASLLEEVRTLLRFLSTENEEFELSGISLTGDRDKTDSELTLERFEVGRLIAKGGMGYVYEGRQKCPQRKVAIKVLAPELMALPSAVERFEREAALLAQLDHPGIVKVIESGECHGRYYIVMEYVAGADGGPPISIQGLLETSPLKASQARDLVLDISDALVFAHRQGVIHRDIKPSNILIDRHGRAKIIDFGIAACVSTVGTKLTGAHIVMGSRAYMSPEQEQNAGVVDERTDIYSLGLVLYEMLCGKLPESSSTLLAANLDAAGKEWQTIAEKATNKNPDNRFRSINDFRNAVIELSNKDRLPDATPQQADSDKRKARPAVPNVIPMSGELDGNQPGVRKGAAVPQALASCLESFEAFIAERTRDFAPRDFIVAQLDEFMRRDPSGYFVIKGHPGMGKSAVLCALVRQRGYLHHFNIAAESRNTAELFFKNVWRSSL